MATWSVVSQFEGYRLSPIIDISCDFDSLETLVSWTSTIPVNTSLVIESNVSYDKGVNWKGWKTLTNGGMIEGLQGDEIDLKDARIQIRESFASSNPDETVILNDFSIDFKPIIFFDNLGDVECKPEMWITKIGNGDMSIINMSNGGKEFKFTGLVNAETVYVDNENEDIETDLLMTYRYTNFNDNYLELLPASRSQLKIIGNFKVNFRYQFKTKQG